MTSVGRLKKRFEYLAVRNADVYMPTKGFILQVLVGKQPSESMQMIPFRFGLTVSKRVGNAVCRNRVKRRLREAVRSAMIDLSVGAPCDVVLIGRRAACDCPYERLVQDFKKALMTCLKSAMTLQKAE